MDLERLDPIANINQILSQASNGSVVSRDRLDLGDVGDRDDREMVRKVIDTLLALEPGNTDLVVHKNTDHPIYLVWAQGMRQPINNGHFRMLYDLRHSIPTFQAVGNVQIFPAKGMQSMKLVVEVNPYGPKRIRQEQDHRRLENGNHNRRELPHSSPMYTERRGHSPSAHRGRSFSRSPSRSPRDRSPRRSPRRSPSPGDSVEAEPPRSKSVLSMLMPTFGGGSKKPPQHDSRRRK